MTNKQTIIFDLDGTAVDSPDQTLPSTRLASSAMALSKSHSLCAATGRTWAYARPVLHSLGLTKPCIISSGTQICDPRTGEILWQNDLKPGSAQQIIKMLRGYDSLHKSKCRVMINDFDINDHFNGGMAVQHARINEQVYIITIVFVPDAVAHDVLARLSSIEYVTCTLAVAQAPGHKDIHVTARGATKEGATIMLLSILRLNADATIGVGDGHNDIHLFKAVKHRVAMGNAVDELKSLADRVIGHVKHDGLAAFFEELSGNGNETTFEPTRSRVPQSIPR